MLNFALSVTVLAALALLAGAVFVWRRTGNRKQAMLMVVLALIAIVNVLIWAAPDASGEAPLGKVEQGFD